MRIIQPACSLIVAALVYSSLATSDALEATGSLWCASVRFNSGSDANNQYTSQFTTVNGFNNGEFSPDQTLMSSPYYTYIYLADNWVEMDDFGRLSLNLPPFQDANQNGFHDFFEPSQAASGISSGTCNLNFNGVVTAQASWSRDAGSPYGTCVIQLKKGPVPFLTLTHGFELLEFKGPLTYIAGANGPVGAVHWVQTGSQDTIFEGQFNPVRVETNRFNQLILPAGAWTNLYTFQAWDFSVVELTRDPGWPTNYYGYVEFSDGSFTTGHPDYQYWLLSIDDLNDSDNDGIPDFSDDVGSPVVQPVLSLAYTGGESLVVTVDGEAGKTYLLLECTGLGATWTTNSTLTMSTPTQSVTIPKGTFPTFFRIKVQ